MTGGIGVISIRARAAHPCPLCGPDPARPAPPVDADAWARSLADAAARGLDEIRWVGGEPLLAPGVADALAAVEPPAGIPIGAETHGLAWATPGLAPALARVARWALVLHVPDAAEQARLLGAPDLAPRVAEGWARLAGSGLPLEVILDPGPLPHPLVSQAPAWVATRLPAGTPLVVRAPRGPMVGATLTRLLRTLAAHASGAGVPLWVDRRVPPCVRGDAETPTRQIPAPPLPLAPSPDACRGCPEAGGARCEGLPAGWRVSADQGARQARRARQPSFRMGWDAEIVGLEIGLRDAARLVLAPTALPAARRALEARGLVTLSGGRREVDGQGNVFAPGVVPGLDALSGAGAAGYREVLVVARDAGTAARVRDLDATIAGRTAGDDDLHRALGRALGYPACCVEAFVSARAARGADAESPAAHFAAARRARDASARLDARVNPFLPDRGTALISHAPCRYDCPASVDAAARVLAELTGRDPAHAAQRLAMLASLVLLTPTGDLLVASATPLGAGWVLGPVHRAEGALAVLRPGDRLGRDAAGLVMARAGSGPEIVPLPAGEGADEALLALPFERAP